jgi:hypothetical protein
MPPNGVGAAPAWITDPGLLAQLGNAKHLAGVDSPAALADMEHATAMSPSSDYKLQRLADRIHAPSAMPIDQACGASGAKRGSLWNQFQNHLVLSAAAAGDGITTWTSNGHLGAALNFINHQGQICTPQCQSDPNHVNYYCGPATVSEASTTENAAVSQATAASYMGTQPPPTGTTVTGITKGVQHFVGVPVKGWTFYAWVNEPWNPPYNYSQFWNDVYADIYNYAMPTVGDAVEVYGFYPNGTPYPHLAGHQITKADSPVYHIFMIGGFDSSDSTIYYTDSATSVWSTVPAFSWFDSNTMVVILGGRGYLW